VNNATVEAHYIFPRRDKGLPPQVLYIALELDTDGTVIEKAGIAIVNFTAGKNESPSFAQSDDIVHGKGKDG
jgi:hypothetical protein